MLTVAVAEPTNVFLIDQLRDIARCEVQIAVASAKDIRRMVQTYLPNTRVFVIDDIIDDANGDAVELIEESIEDIGAEFEIGDQSPIIRLVNYILFNAAKEGASDIHIEPKEKALKIRYRIDGVLFEAMNPPHFDELVECAVDLKRCLQALVAQPVQDAIGTEWLPRAFEHRQHEALVSGELGVPCVCDLLHGVFPSLGWRRAARVASAWPSAWLRSRRSPRSRTAGLPRE